MTLYILGHTNGFVKDRCFPLSVNDCDCDVVFYCKLICEDEGAPSEYDSATETCCCKSGK
jgi:hypothetical protein